MGFLLWGVTLFSLHVLGGKTSGSLERGKKACFINVFTKEESNEAGKVNC